MDHIVNFNNRKIKLIQEKQITQGSNKANNLKIEQGYKSDFGKFIFIDLKTC